MALWCSFVIFAVVAVGAVRADSRLAFPEDARAPGSNRIVSGWESEVGQFPFQVSLRMTNGNGQVSGCGGSVIHDEWVLTAAHCTALRRNIIIRFGTVNLTLPELVLESSEWYNHPDYLDALQSVVQPHDIALLKLDRAVPFSANIQPVRMHRSLDKDKNYAGIRLTASGWGVTWTSGSSPENMNWVYLVGESNPTCWTSFSGSSIIVDSTICASAYNVSSQSTCSGDSGGPLTVVDDDGQLSLVGVASFVSGTGCHTPVPAGFIRPGHYHDWYQLVTGINFDWDFEDQAPEAPEETRVVE